MNIISEKMLKDGINGQTVSGVILVKSYTTQLTKNNKEYIAGTMHSGMDISFKAWSSSPAFAQFKNYNYNGLIVFVTGEFNEYNGTMSLVIDNVSAVAETEGFTEDMFLKVVYDADAYFKAMIELFEANVSDKCKELANKTFFSNEELVKRFKLEFAGSGHHDNCKSGLLAHTYKVLRTMKYFTNLYASILTNESGVVNQDMKDLLFYGAMMHDIGKVWEMNLGVYQEVSTVTHRFLGIEVISPFKSEIVEMYDEKWYYDLVSIFLQHHGEYGDDCRTLPALLVHKADMLDSELTLLAQSMKNFTETSGGKRIKFNGKYISI